jgi:TolA-binding protein
MDCEKFDRIVLDLLYGELDELTDASARRHIEHCSRCKGISSSLRATREVGALELVDPRAGLELGILEAERKLNARLPLSKKAGRVVSILAVYAMRPQVTMAALLMLVIGSSLFLMRARPDGDSVLVTERGVPETEAEHVAIAPAPEQREERPPSPRAAAASPAPLERNTDGAEKLALPASSAAPELEAKAEAPLAEAIAAESEGDSLEAANEAFSGGRYVEAQRRFEEIATRGGTDAAAAALSAVEALRRQSGCPAAAPRYAEVHARHRGTPAGSEAAWQAGDCYRALGETARARSNFEALLDVAEYRSRARAAIDELKDHEQAVAARKAKSPANADAAPAKPAAKATGKAAASESETR